MKQPKVAICFFLFTIMFSPSAVRSMVFPDPDWQDSTPEAQGFDSVKLGGAMQYLENNSGPNGTSQAIVIVDGFIIWKGNDIDSKHYVWSCAKSFTSTILGLLIDDGRCTLDSPAKNYDTNLAADYPGLNLRHFVTMTSGYNADGDDQSGTPFEVAPPLYSPPGSANDYWDAATNEFSYVLTLINGEAIDTLFRKRIADPIGMNQWSWGDLGEVGGLKVNGGAGNYGGISISASELARFGLLFLNRGYWDGTPLISSSWIDQAARLQVPLSVPWMGLRFDVSGQYGYGWWVNDPSYMKWNGAPEGTYAAAGLNNNMLFVIPKWKMVVVRLGPEGDGDIEDEIWGTFFSKIGEARQDAPISPLPYFNGASLPNYVIQQDRVYFSGFARDDIDLSQISMSVSGPAGTHNVFSTSISGTSHDLTQYHFNSSDASYANMLGSYVITLTITDSIGQTTSKAFPISITEQKCEKKEIAATSTSQKIYDPDAEPSPNQSHLYKYGPAIILSGNTVDMWASSPDPLVPRDRVEHRRGIMAAEGTIDWITDWTSVLEATSNSRDTYSVCDPSVFSYNGYYYIGYTSTDQNVDGGGVSNDVFVARFNGLPDGSPGVTVEKWNGSGWGGEPYPIIEYTGTNWGKGQPSFVVKGNILYIYYTDEGTKILTVDLTDENWPAQIDESLAHIVFTNNDASQIYGGNPGPLEVKYVDALETFLGITVVNRFNAESYVLACESQDGITFSPIAASKDYWGTLVVGDGGPGGAHNVGISGDSQGHLDISLNNFIAYGYGLHQTIEDQLGYVARWPTFNNKIEIALIREDCNRAPQITSTAPASAAVGTHYSYAPTASDPDGDTLTWSLTNAPSGMQIDAASGIIAWAPATGTTTSGNVILTVMDGNGGEDTDAFIIGVSTGEVSGSGSSSSSAGGGGGGCFISTASQSLPGQTIIGGLFSISIFVFCTSAIFWKRKIGSPPDQLPSRQS